MTDAYLRDRQVLDKIFLLVGTGSVAFSQLLLLAAIARFGDGVAALGTYGLATALISPTRMGLEMGLRQVVASDGRLDNNMAIFWKVRASAILVTTLVCSAGSLFMVSDLDELFVMAGVLVLRTSDSAADLAYGVFQNRSKGISQGLAMLGRSSVTLCGVVVSAVLFGDIGIALLTARGVGWLWFALVEFIVASRYARTAPTEPSEAGGSVDLRSLGRVLVPVGFAGLFSSGSQAVPRLALNYFGGRELLGAWTAVYSIGQLVGMINQSMLAATTGRLANAYNLEGKEVFLRVVRRVIFWEVGTLSILVLGVYLLAPYAMQVVFGHAFDASSSLLLLILIAKIFDALKSYLKYGHVVERQVWPLLLIACASLVIAIVLSVAFVPSYGLHGAAAVVIAIAFSTASAHAVVFSRKSPSKACPR